MSLLLPDFFAMAVLLGVLFAVRRRYPHQDIRLWIGGLLLILLECAARIVYSVDLPPVWHQAAHIVALNSYFLAGVLFLRSSFEDLRRMPRAGIFVWFNTVPGLVLLTLYGGGATETAVYVSTALCGVGIALVTTLTMGRSRVYLASLLATWLPVAGATLLGMPRLAAYTALAGLYLMTAAVFAWTLPRQSSGRLAVVSGFVLWSACFGTHPWIAARHPEWVAFAGQVWDMQKFLITVGLLLVLIEKQADSNEWLALHDQLTGLPNRRLFQDRISNAIARAERDRTAFLLFVMDLNHFKEVNDTLGHDAGDTVLRGVCANLEQVVRRTDTLARVGGDEFVLVATDFRTPDSQQKERSWLRAREGSTSGERAVAEHAEDFSILRHAARIEQNLRNAVNRPIPLVGRNRSVNAQISVSIGVAVYPDDATLLDELTDIADQRMFEDKRSQNAQRGGLERVLSMLSA